LEENLRKDGCRDPLVVWAGRSILLDGHHRYEICRRRGITFAIRPLELATREEAKIWIIQNQLGRRNLEPFQRAELALNLKPLIEAGAKERRRQAAEAKEAQEKLDARASEELRKTPPPNLAERAQRETRTQLAKAAGIGHETLRKAEIIARQGSEQAKERLRRGETSIHHEYQILKPPPKPPAPKTEIIDIRPVSVTASPAPEGATPRVYMCDKPGCDEEAFKSWTVSRCAMHLEIMDREPMRNAPRLGRRNRWQAQ
jgi:hypothetical protein